VSLVNHKAPVHQSLLEIIAVGRVPFQAAMANVAQTFLLTVTLQWWRYLLVGVVVHGILWCLTGDDPNRIYKIWRYLGYASYYRAG
jgi:hypothetical protein